MVRANLILLVAVLAKVSFHRLNRNTVQPMLTDTHHPWVTWVDPWVDAKALRSTPTEG